MFSTLFQSLFTKNKQNAKTIDDLQIVDTIYKKEIESKLDELNELLVDNSSNVSINDAFEQISISDFHADNELINDEPVDNFDDSKSEISSIEEKAPLLQETDSANKKIINQINSLQCLFTWNIKPNNNKNIILKIQKKYGEYNLNISSPEFTFPR